MEDRRARILLIEDDPGDVLLVGRSIESPPAPASDFELHHATTLRQGLTRLAKDDIDVLLLDLHLPDSGGPETVARVREHDVDVPIVVFTTAGDETTAIRTLNAGAQDYLVKNELTISLLRRSIRYAIARQTIARQNKELTREATRRAEELERLNKTLTEQIAARAKAEEERWRLERKIRQAQKLKSIGLLARGVAHDFNNLLVSVLGNASLLLMDLLPDSRSRARVRQIQTAAQRAADLTKQLLAYSGEAKFTVQPVDLSALVKEMADLLAVSISRDARLEYHLARDLPAIEGDPVQVRQVVMNLIINASEAMEKEGVISLRTGIVEADEAYLSAVHLEPCLPEGQYVCLEVSDTGRGMDKATTEKIFDPFFTTKPSGHGLGLSAVLGIVRGHRGAIKVASEHGNGTTFTILFATATRFAEIAAKAAPSPEGWRGDGTILVVDDEESVRATVQEMLERFGFTVLTAEHGRRGIEIFRLRSAEIVAVVLDMTMPGMPGEEVLDELRRIRSDVPVVLSSGYNERTLRDRLGDTAGRAFLQKPYEPAQLMQELRVLLQC